MDTHYEYFVKQRKTNEQRDRYRILPLTEPFWDNDRSSSSSDDTANIK